MEEDSFAFYIFSGFVAISTVISWAIVTYITRENTYENAKRQAQEDMSWMENNSTQNTPIKGNIKAPKVKKTPVKTTKTKIADVEHRVAVTVNASEHKKVQIPVVTIEPEKEVTVSSKAVSAPKASLDNKPKTPKKPKETPNKSPAIANQKASKQNVAKEKSAKVSVKKIDLFADEESDHEEWQSVPMKSSKVVAAKSGGKAANSTKGESKKKQSEHEKDKQSQGSKLEVSLPKGGTPRGAATGVAVAQFSPSGSSLTTTEPEESRQQPQKGMTSSLSKLNVNNCHDVHSSSHYMSNGEGSPVSDGLEHSDSTEELIERTTFATTRNANASKAAKNADNLPSSTKPNSNAKPPSTKGKPNMVEEASLKSSEGKQLSSAASRTKRASERSGASMASGVDSKGKDTSGKKTITGGETVELSELLKLEDELKRERNHSQDLRCKFLQLTDQNDREKKTYDSVAQQLQLKVQENAELKSRIAQLDARGGVSAMPSMSAKDSEELQNLRTEAKRNETKFMALKKENDVLRNELGSTKASLHGAKHEYQLQVQSAEAQLKQIEVKNKELQEQCNKYQMQLQASTPQPAPTPSHNQDNYNTLLAQLTDTEDKVKVLKRENDLLKQNHEASYAEMSRLTDSKIALQKHNSSLQEEVHKLQHELSSVKSEMPNGATAPTNDAAPSDYDWSQVNSDLKKLAQLEVSVAELSKENATLKEEKARLEKIHSSSAKEHLPNGGVHHQASENGEVSNGEKGDPAQDIISLKEVETELKKCVLRVYPEISSTTSMQSDCIAFIAQFEKHARSSMSQLSEQESKLNQQVVSLQDEISKAISEKEHLARENERYLSALNKTEAFVLNLENALATVEAEHKELTEENNILRHDTDKAVELQIELDQAKLELAKLQQNQGELQSRAESLTTKHCDEQSRAKTLDDNLQSLQSKFDLLQQEKVQIEQQLLEYEAKRNFEISAQSSQAAEDLQRLTKKSEEDEIVIKDLKEKYSSQVEKSQSMEEKINSFESQVAEMKNEIQESQNHKTEQSRQIQEKEQSIERINAEKSDMQKLIDDLKSKNEMQNSTQSENEQKLCNELQVKENEVNELRAKLTEVQTSAASECEKLKKEVEQLNSSLTRINEDLQNKNGEIETKNQEIESLKEIQGKNSEVSENEIKQLKEQCSKLSDEVSELKKHLELKTSEVEASAKSSDEKNQKVASLESEICELRKQLDSRNSEVESKTKSFEEKNQHVNALQEEITQLKTQLPELQNLVSEKEKELEKLKCEKSELQISVEEKEKSITSLANQNAQCLDSVKQEREQAESKVNELEKQLSSSAEKHQQEKQQLAKQLSQIEESKKAAEDKVQKLEAEMTETKKTLEAELAQTKKNFESEMQSKKTLEAELAETKKSLNEALASAATVAAISSAIDNNSDTQSIGSTLSVSTKDVPSSTEKDKGKDKEKKKGFSLLKKGKKDKDES